MSRPDPSVAAAMRFAACARHLRNLTPRALTLQFHISLTEADQIIRYEQARRGAQTT